MGGVLATCVHRKLCVPCSAALLDPVSTLRGGHAAGTARAFASEPSGASTEKAGKLGTSTPDRMWLPHDLIPLGSPIFYVALVFIPIVIYLNEREQSQTARDNERLREERMRRFVRCGAVRCAQLPNHDGAPFVACVWPF